MSANLDAKKLVVEEIKQKISESKSIAFVDYSGLNVEKDTELRKKFKASLDYTKTDNRKRLLEMFVNSVYLHDNYAYVAYNGISKPRELYFANKKSYSNKKFEYDSIGAPVRI